MSKAGAPKGNNNAGKNKSWADALRRELAGNQNANKLKAIAQKVIEMAQDGDMQAIKEIGDRLDGKPTQQISGDITHDHTHHHEGLQDADSRIDDILRRGEAPSNPTSKPH